MRLPTNLLRFFGFGVAVAIVVGAAPLLSHGDAWPRWVTPVLSGLIVVVSWLVMWPKLPKPAPRAKDSGTGIPPVGTRRWARMMFHNGLISVEELNQFYVDNPD